MRPIEPPVFLEKDGKGGGVVFTPVVLPTMAGELVAIVVPPALFDQETQIFHLAEGDVRQLRAFLDAVLENHEEGKKR